MKHIINLLIKNNQKKQLNLKDTRKFKFFIFFSLLEIIMFIILGYINFLISKESLMGIILFSGSIIITLNLVVIIIIKKINIANSISILLCAIILSYTMVNGGVTNLAIIWILIFPLIAYYLKGKLWGTISIFFFMLVSLCFILLGQFKILNNPYPLSTILYVFSEFIIISLMVYFYENTFSNNEEIILKQLYLDPLTNLFNRRKMLEDLIEIKKCRLILINVDDFKEINDIYGSKIGDQIIIEIANRIKKIVNDIKNLYKLHADEFAIILDYKINKGNIKKLVENINKSLSTDFYINNNEITISISTGISETKYDMLAEADIALKLSKEKKINYVFFDRSMKIKEKYENNLILLKKLKNGIENNNIIPYFQPIVNNTTLKIEKYECLARLLYNNEIIAPHSFLDLAKRAKIYPHITCMMIVKVLNIFFDKEHEFSINLSIDDIMNNDTVEFIFNSIKNFNMPQKIIFELVESEKIEESDEIKNFIYKAKNLGCKIAIDDFGSGYSNFDYVLRMNVDYIKIDASLIKKLDTDMNSMIITETIVNFCKKLQIKTIAEFVCSNSIYEKVKNLGIDYSQGYYFGKPKKTILKNNFNDNE